MTNKKDNLPIHRPSSELTSTKRASKDIVNGMVKDVLSGAKELSKPILYKLAS